MQYGSEVFAFASGEQSGDVFKDRESRVFSIGGTPHFVDNSDRLEEEAASLPLMNPRLLPRNGEILAVVNDDPVRDVTIVLLNSQIIDALHFAGRLNFLNRIPAVTTRPDISTLLTNYDRVGIPLIDDSVFDGRPRWAPVKIDRCCVSERLRLYPHTMGELFADCRQFIGFVLHMIAIRVHLSQE